MTCPTSGLLVNLLVKDGNRIKYGYCMHAQVLCHVKASPFFPLAASKTFDKYSNTINLLPYACTSLAIHQIRPPLLDACLFFI